MVLRAYLWYYVHIPGTPCSPKYSALTRYSLLTPGTPCSPQVLRAYPVQLSNGSHACSLVISEGLNSALSTPYSPKVLRAYPRYSVLTPGTLYSSQVLRTHPVRYSLLTRYSVLIHQALRTHPRYSVLTPGTPYSPQVLRVKKMNSVLIRTMVLRAYPYHGTPC